MDNGVIANIISKYTDILLRFIAVKVNSEYDRWDIIQEVFYSFIVANRKKRFDSDKYIKNWLFRVASNKVTDYIRKKYKTIDAETEINDWDAPDMNIFDSGENPSIYKALRHLPEKQAKTVWLHYYFGYGVKEISEMFSVSPNTVKVNLMKGRDNLKKLLSEE